MANICYTTLKIIGYLDKVKQVSEVLINTDFDIEKIVPYEEFPKAFIDDYEAKKEITNTNVDKYEFFYSCHAWINGEKEIQFHSYDKNGKELYSKMILLNSKWEPPISSVFALAHKYKDLVFDCSYSEGMADFAGIFIFENGKLVKREHKEDFFSSKELEREEEENKFEPYMNSD